MRKELCFWIKGLRNDNHNKDLIKMLISYWCKIVSWILAILVKRSLKDKVESIHNHKVVLLQITKVVLIFLVLIENRIELLCHNNKGEVMILIKEKSQMEWKMTLVKIKIKSNIISFTLIQLKEQLRWCESNIKLRLWWEWIKKTPIKKKGVPNIKCTNLNR